MLEYAQKHGLHALVVVRDGSTIYEAYGDDFTIDTPHALYSGSKSFWGTAALVAQREGLIDLDAPLDIEGVTYRMLLSMTAGYGFGGLGNAVPVFEKALAAPLKHSPGARFVYSGIPLQVFGAHFTRALQPLGLTPHEFLTRRVLEPAGVAVDRWRTLADGTHPLPTGAFLSARAWLAYGGYMLAHRDDYAEALRGSRANPRYGLCWWLASPGLPQDIFYASGSGGQALYIVPSRAMVVVHFGKSTSYKHETMLKRVLNESG